MDPSGTGEKQERDELAESLNDLFTNLSAMVKGELQGTNNLRELLEKMNLRVAEEYKSFGDVASGQRVFVEQLKSKSGSFDEYIQQIDAIEQQVTEFKAEVLALLRSPTRRLKIWVIPPEEANTMSGRQRMVTGIENNPSRVDGSRG
ncbi:hypothetical protein U1Q18_038513 [Sarracenia purpurea var. burkii]